MELDTVTIALKGLTSHGGRSPPSKRSEAMGYFCVEDTFLSKDITVAVDGLEELTFPLTEDAVQSIIQISSKAQFGRKDETLKDTTVRDAQVITQDMLKVEINEQSLAGVLKRMGSALYLSEECKLVPYLYNMLVYGPGQFFKKRRDSEKIKNMVATLIIVLPSAHEGGDLIVEHRNKQHVFFGSQNPDFIKCVIFYADCFHRIRKVTKGYRVALTYNIVLESPGLSSITETNEGLFKAVDSYFSGSSTDIPDRLVYFLNHSYTENSLKWDLLKGTDRIRVYNLVAVARKLKLMPYLALVDYQETRDMPDYSNCLDTNIEIQFCVDDLNFEFRENVPISEDEICFTKETSQLVEPYKTEEEIDTGNEGATRDYWYCRACVILCSNKWAFSHGVKYFIDSLHKLITEKENKNVLVEKIYENKENFLKSKYWNQPESPASVDKLFEVVIYLDNKEIAVSILSKLGNTILSSIDIDLVKVLDRKFDEETWKQIIHLWVDNGCSVRYTGYDFVKEYAKIMGKSPLVQSLLKVLIENCTSTIRVVQHFVTSRMVIDTTRLCELLKICSELEISSLEDQLIDHVISTPVVFTAEIVLELLTKLHSFLRPQHFSRYEVLRDSALDNISETITELKEDVTGWNILTIMPCKCQLCTDIENFFFSKTSRRYELPGPEAKRKHVLKKLDMLSNQPIKYKTEKKGGPAVLVIEKDSHLLQNRKAKLNVVTSLKERLDQFKFENASPNAKVKETKVDEEPDVKRHKP